MWETCLLIKQLMSFRTSEARDYEVDDYEVDRIFKRNDTGVVPYIMIYIYNKTKEIYHPSVACTDSFSRFYPSIV